MKCQLVSGGQKTPHFCHDRTKVILLHKIAACSNKEKACGGRGAEREIHAPGGCILIKAPTHRVGCYPERGQVFEIGNFDKDIQPRQNPSILQRKCMPVWSCHSMFMRL
jgi:hypothetical protein